MHIRCKVDNCTGLGLLQSNGRYAYSKGYCVKHYGRLLRHGDVNYLKRVSADGRSTHPLHHIYHDMKARCYSVTKSDYKHYGARGIKVSEDWLGHNGFWQFVADMGERPDGYTLDRICVDGDYSRDNCRRSNRRTQQCNKRNNSKTPGVRKISYGKNREAFIGIGGKHIYLGSFSNYDAAVEARKTAEKLIGEEIK